MSTATTFVLGHELLNDIDLKFDRYIGKFSLPDLSHFKYNDLGTHISNAGFEAQFDVFNAIYEHRKSCTPFILYLA